MKNTLHIMNCQINSKTNDYSIELSVIIISNVQCIDNIAYRDKFLYGDYDIFFFIS